MRLSVGIATILAALTVVFGVVAGVLVGPFLGRAVERGERQEMAALTATLGASLARDVVGGDRAAALLVLRQIADSGHDHLFAYLIDFDGQVFAHTFAAGFPQQLLDAAAPTDGQSLRMVRLSTGEPIAEASALLVPGRRARLHVGHSTSWLHAMTTETLRVLALALAGFVALVAGLGWATGRRITRPLMQMAAQLNRPEAAQTLEPLQMQTWGFEAAHLQRALNGMIKQLRDNRILLEMVFESIPHSLIVKDAESRYVLVNSAHAQVYGSEPADWIGRRTAEVACLSDELKAGLIERDMTVIRTGRPLRSEDFPVRLPNGETRIFEMIKEPLHNAAGEVTGVLGLGVDITQRVQTEDALRAERNFSTAVFDSTPAYVIVHDSSGRIVRFNNAVAAATGYGLQELQDQFTWDTLMGTLEEKQAVRQRYAQLDHLTCEEALARFGNASERIWRTKDGRLRTIAWNLAYLPDEQGRVAYQVASGLDITESRAAAAALRAAETSARESAQRLRAFIEGATDHIVLYDANLNVLDLNPKALARIGRLRNEALGSNLLELLPAVRVEKRDQHYLEVLRTRQPKVIEAAIDHPTLGRREMEIRLFPVGDGLGTIASDVTERKRLELALREHRRLLQAVFDTVPHWLFVKDRQGRFLMTNGNYADYFGLKPEDFVGKLYSEVVQLPDAPRLEESEFMAQQLALSDKQDRLALRYGATTKYEYKMRNLLGQTMIRLVVKMPLRDETGAVNGIVGISEDITDFRMAQEELGRLNKGLEKLVDDRTAELHQAQSELIKKEKLATIGQLTATVSHELRNPLGTIRTSTFHLKERLGQQDAGVVRTLERIDRNVARCDNIITDLLDFSRTRPARSEPTPVADWLAALLQEQELPQWLQVELDLADVAGLVIALDQDHFRRAVINVVENAIQAMEVTAGDPALPGRASLTLRCRRTAERLVLTVEDTGPGMTPEVLTRIFEPLYSTKVYGVGLGLATVKQIMESEGGGIEIHSQPGQGTQVVLWIALADRINGVA